MNFKYFSRSIKIRIALKFLTTFSNTAVMPFIVILFADQIGTKMTAILIVLIGFTSIIGAWLGGHLADKYGRKKIILIGELLCAIGFLIVVFSNSEENLNIAGSLIGFLLIYFFSSLSQPAYSAFIIDETNEENRKSVYSFMMWVSYLAFALGSTIGGMLFASFKIELFIFVAICSIISFITVAIWIPESYIKIADNKETINIPSTTHNVYINMFKSPIFLILAYMTFIFSVMDNQLAYYLSIRYIELFHEEGYQLLGFLYTENTILSVLLLLWLTKKLKKYKEVNTAIIGAILFFIGYFLLSFIVQPIYLFIAMAIVTIGEVILSPSLQIITANIIPDSNRARYLSVFNIFSTIGGLCAALFLLLIPIFSSVGFTVLFGLIGLLSILILFNLKRL